MNPTDAKISPCYFVVCCSHLCWTKVCCSLMGKKCNNINKKGFWQTREVVLEWNWKAKGSPISSRHPFSAMLSTRDRAIPKTLQCLTGHVKRGWDHRQKGHWEKQTLCVTSCNLPTHQMGCCWIAVVCFSFKGDLSVACKEQQYFQSLVSMGQGIDSWQWQL